MEEDEEEEGGTRAMGRPWESPLTSHGATGVAVTAVVVGHGGFQRAGRYRVRSISTVSPHLQVNQARVSAAREAGWYT